MKARRSKCCAPRRIQMRDLCLALLWTFWSRRLVCKEKPRKCFVWNFDPWTRGAFFEPILYACRMCWLPLRPETAVKESEAAQLGPLKKIFQWFRHDAPNQAWRTDVADGCLTRFCKISWFQERERERESGNVLIWQTLGVWTAVYNIMRTEGKYFAKNVSLSH